MPDNTQENVTRPPRPPQPAQAKDRSIHPFTRLTLCLLMAAAALAVTRYVVLPKLPGALKVCHTIAFDLSPVDSASANWQTFVERQRIDMMDSCRRDYPRLLRHLTISSAQPGRISVQGSFSGITDEPSAELHALISNHLQRYRDRCELLSRQDIQLPADASVVALKKWLAEQRQQLAQLEATHLDLLNQYSVLATQMLGGEHRLNMRDRAISEPNSIPEFETFLAPQLAAQLAADPNLNRARRELNYIQAEQALLTTQAGHSTDPNELAGLDQRQITLARRAGEMQTAIDREDTRCRQTVRLELWPAYAGQVKEQTRQRVEQLDANARQRELLAGTINQARKHIEFVQSFLPDESAPSPAQAARQLQQTITQLSRDEFLPPLAANQPICQQVAVWSMMQIMTLFSSILAGAAFGLLIGPHKKAAAVLPAGDDVPAITQQADTADDTAAAPAPAAANRSNRYHPTLSSDEAASLQSPAVANSRRVEPAAPASTLSPSILKPIVDYCRAGQPPLPAVVVLYAARPELASPRIAINLAIGLTRAGLKTLLLELDAQQALSAILLQDAEPAGGADRPDQLPDGLYDWLAGGVADLPVYPTPLPGLLFTPRGRNLSTPAIHPWSRLKNMDSTQLNCLLIYCPDGLFNGNAPLLPLADFVLSMSPRADEANPTPPAGIDPARYLGCLPWLP